MQIHAPESLAFTWRFEILSPFKFLFYGPLKCFTLEFLPRQTLLEINWSIVGSEGSFYHLEIGIILGYNKS